MNSKRNYFENLKKPYESAFRRQKQFAFLTTAAAFFCLLCFVSSIYMKEFETISYVDISASGEKPELLFENAISKEITAERLREHVEFAATQSGLQDNVDLQNIDYENIRESFDFKIAPNRAGRQFRLSASYTGSGVKAEQILTGAVIRSVAERLGAVNNMANALSAFDDKYELVQNSIEVNAQQLHNELGDANQLVNELNSQLSDVHEAVQLIRPDAGEAPGSLAQGEIEEDRLDSLLTSLVDQLEQFSRANQQQEKQQIGHSIAKINDQLKAMDLPSSGEAGTSMRIINASLPESNSATKSILALLENLDTDTIHARIGQVQNNLRAGTVQLREEVSELRSLTDRFSESRFVVNEISEARTRPAASAPSIGHVFLFGLVAMIAASVVATYYRPEQENRGFESIESVKETLNIPVISEIAGDGESDSKREAWGNKVVRYSEVGLFGFVLLSAILCFIQPEIRTAFFESPFYGMSKIANLFF